MQNIPYVTNGNNIQIDYDVTFKVVNMLGNFEFEAEKPATLVYGKPNTFSQLVDVFALWETESIPAGDYFVYFYDFYGNFLLIDYYCGSFGLSS